MMKINYKYFILLFSLLIPLSLGAQSPSDLRINELMINNVDNLADEYGKHVPWVEIFNTSYNSVDIAGCYLTNDTTGFAAGDPSRWYRIPLGDPKTVVPTRGFVIFYLDNLPTYGVFHTNFDPSEPTSSNYIALISQGGRKIIDFFEFPASLRDSTAIHTYGYKKDYGADSVLIDGILVKNKGELDYFTPGAQNYPIDEATKAEIVQQRDKYGLALMVIAMTVVFSSLFIIFVVMKLSGRLNALIPAWTKKYKDKKQGITSEPSVKDGVESTNVDSGEEMAAIGMALHLYFDTNHDYESEIITIETPKVHASPWAQKQLIHRRIPRRK